MEGYGRRRRPYSEHIRRSSRRYPPVTARLIGALPRRHRLGEGHEPKGKYILRVCHTHAERAGNCFKLGGVRKEGKGREWRKVQRIRNARRSGTLASYGREVRNNTRQNPRARNL